MYGLKFTFNLIYLALLVFDIVTKQLYISLKMLFLFEFISNKHSSRNGGMEKVHKTTRGRRDQAQKGTIRIWVMPEWLFLYLCCSQKSISTIIYVNVFERELFLVDFVSNRLTECNLCVYIKK